jgi:hypothetical protein
MHLHFYIFLYITKRSTIVPHSFTLVFFSHLNLQSVPLFLLFKFPSTIFVRYSKFIHSSNFCRHLSVITIKFCELSLLFRTLECMQVKCMKKTKKNKFFNQNLTKQQYIYLKIIISLSKLRQRLEK